MNNIIVNFIIPLAKNLCYNLPLILKTLFLNSNYFVIYRELSFAFDTEWRPWRRGGDSSDNNGRHPLSTQGQKASR